MADKYKKEMHSRCCVEGLNCRCCNDFAGKDKKKLNRIARRVIKQEDDKKNKLDI